MLDVIDLFAESDTRDELGLSAIRDAFAEAFFPGVSVVQTRARYLLFIPWIYLGLERRGVSAAHVGDRARREETALINVLAEADDHDGTIGIQAREKLKRLPSNVYWQALRRYGIQLFPGRQDAYHRSFDAFHARTAGHHARTRERDEPPEEATPHNWHPGLPAPPADFPTKATFRLRKVEGRYLQERIMTAAPRTLLAFLVDRGRVCEPTDFPWEHRQHNEFPSELRERLRHARHFSLAVHGAALLYNLMLAEEVESARPELQEEYRTALGAWAGALKAEAGALAGWDRGQFWEAVSACPGRVSLPCRAFVNRWLDLALTPRAASGIADHAGARQVIKEREQQLKGALARLGRPRALELWNGASGTARLNYRWQTVQTIVNDILTALNAEAPDA
jgi:hypothetical protein